LPNPENVNEVDSANPNTGKIENNWTFPGRMVTPGDVLPQYVEGMFVTKP
jgi:hypothetical protein